MDAVEAVKERLNIEDVVAEYVELKRAGRNFKGLSPFTAEKTPSFIVSPEKQIWHDFSSGKGGNVFSFVMEMEGLDFKGALELLARKAGVDLSQYRDQRSGDYAKHKERLGAALELAAKFYQVQFSKNQKALEYIFKKRGFSKEVALAFKLGYSPNTGRALLEFMEGKGFNAQELKQAGLGVQRYQQWSDMFRGRIMIPLMDPFGAVVGFTARLLEDDPQAPKYINTPQTILYDKSRHVFGLHLAKEAIRHKKYAVLVEGNLDVIASHQVDVKQTIATAGTALTPHHLKSLSRLTNDIRLSFDQDKAGLAAAERAIPIADKADVSLSIITVPGHKDPDELIKQNPKLWEKAIEDKQYALDWLIERYQANLDLNSAQGKRQFSDVLLPVVRALEDSVEQDHYIGRISQLTGINVDALRSKLTTQKRDVPRPLKKSVVSKETINRSFADMVKSQNKLLALCLVRADLRNYLDPLQEDMFSDKPAQTVFRFLRHNPEFKGALGKAPELQQIGDYVKILSLQFEELYQGLETLELQYEAARLQARLIEEYVKIRKSELAHIMRGSDEADMPQLLQQAKALDTLLRNASPPKVSRNANE